MKKRWQHKWWEREVERLKVRDPAHPERKNAEAQLAKWEAWAEKYKDHPLFKEK